MMQLNRVGWNYYQCKKPPKTGHSSWRHSSEIIKMKSSRYWSYISSCFVAPHLSRKEAASLTMEVDKGQRISESFFLVFKYSKISWPLDIHIYLPGKKVTTLLYPRGNWKPKTMMKWSKRCFSLVGIQLFSLIWTPP
jgi:hypothetical protein